MNTTSTAPQEKSAQRRRKWYRSIFAKLGIVLLFSLLVMGALNVFLTIQVWSRLSQDFQQLRHWDLAGELATRLQPRLSRKIDEEHILHAMYNLSISHPTVDFYLIAEDGTIVFSLKPEGQYQLRKIDLAPILEASDMLLPELPVLGDNPIDGTKTVFSAAKTTIEGKPGFAYLVLSNSLAEAMTRQEGQYYVIGYAGMLSGLIALFAGLLGLLLFLLLSKNFRRLLQIVRQYTAGELSARIPVNGDDEVAELSTAINQMAGQIEQTLDELEQTDRSRRELVAGVSHDLRGPLMIIEGYAQLLSSNWETLEKSKRSEYLDSINRNVEQQKKLISDLFDLSKLEAQEKVPHKEPFSLAELCHDIVQERQAQATESQQTLEVQSPDNLPEAFADVALIARVLTNLIDNACRYSGPGSTIVVALSNKPTEIEVTVRDTGCGIAPEDLPRIFDSFYRADKSRTSSRDGSGLGLAIVRSIIKAHDKEISVESTIDQGTSFTFCLDNHQETQ